MRKVFGVIGILSVLTVTACGSDEVQSAYADDYKELVNSTSSDFVKEIANRAVDNGTISSADYAESRDRLQNCLTENGFEIDVYYDDPLPGLRAIGYATDSNTEQQRSLYANCYDKWDGGISGLYSNQITNPSKADFDSLVAECLVANKLVPDGFTAADYREYKDSYAAKCEDQLCTMPDGTTYNIGEGEELPLMTRPPLPGGRDGEDPEVVKCANFPIQNMPEEK